jgi:hypothetical protein
MFLQELVLRMYVHDLAQAEISYVRMLTACTRMLTACMRMFSKQLTQLIYAHVLGVCKYALIHSDT